MFCKYIATTSREGCRVVRKGLVIHSLFGGVLSDDWGRALHEGAPISPFLCPLKRFVIESVTDKTCALYVVCGSGGRVSRAPGREGGGFQRTRIYQKSKEPDQPRGIRLPTLKRYTLSGFLFLRTTRLFPSKLGRYLGYHDPDHPFGAGKSGTKYWPELTTL